jgi:hypothetical protein
MFDQSAPELEIKSRRAYVVYDGQSGAIVHVHQVTTYRGAKGLTRQEDKARALKVAKQFGHRAKGLRVLTVDPGKLDLSVAQRVSLKIRRLIPDEMEMEGGR